MNKHNRMSLPPRAPRYKSILRLQRFMRNPIPFMNENLRQYGDTYCFSLRYNKVNILTVDPDIIQHILRKNAANYEKPMAHTDALGKFVGRGILLAMGQEHSRRRKMMVPAFRPRAMNVLADSMSKTIDLYLDGLSARIADDPILNIGEEIRVLTFRVMCRAIFGEAMNKEMEGKFFDNFQTLQNFITKLVRIPSLMKWYNIYGKLKDYEKLAEQNNGIILDFIQSRKGETEQNDLLGLLMECLYEDGNRLADEQLLEESLILFVAGHETTTNILSWTFYLLSQHPDCVRSIIEEADEKLDGKPYKFDHLLKLQYLNQVLDECLRLYPPSWITDRVALADDHVNGFDIPKGARVIPFIYGLHHSEKLWPDPEKFDPSRFTTEARKSRHNFAHMPFGAGPRMCLGRHFAMMEMKMILLKMLKRFKFKMMSDRKVGILPAVTLKPKNPIRFHVEKIAQRQYNEQ